MTGRRQHSRDGAASERTAHAGADQLRAAAAEAALGGSGGAGAQQPAGQAQPMQPGMEYVSKADFDALAVQLEEAVRKRDEHLGDLQRLAAEFDNFRKRAAREREQAATGAESRLLGEMLAVLDDLDRAMEQVGEDADSPLAQGIAMVRDRLEGVLRGHGLTEIEAQGQFDPHLHEAVAMQPAEGAEDGQILAVVQKGYRMGDRVLRHTRVVVAGST